MSVFASPETVAGGRRPFSWAEVAEHFNASSAIPTASILIAAGVVIMLVGAVAVWGWWRRRHTHPSPLTVFNRIAGASGLGLSDRWLLIRIARQQGLPSPIALMLSPATLEHHGEAWAQSCGASPGEARQQAQQLVRRLFGADEPTPPHTAAAASATPAPRSPNR